MQRKLISALAVFFLFTSILVAQDIPVMKTLLVIQDDYENPELNAISDGTKMDYGLVSQFLDTIEKTGVVKIEKTLIRGRTATKATVEGLVKNMRMSEKDIFFFYFSGHGGMEKKRTFLSTTEEGTLWRDDLEKMVNARPARLKFIITDACSSSIEAMAPRGKLGSKAKTNEENPYTEIYRHLFQDFKGTLHITAASEGEFAWSGDTGGLFTKSFFTETLLQNPKMTWEENIKDAQSKTQEKFSLMVNAGLFDKATVADLDNRGIKTQKPMAYSIPAAISSTPVAPPVVTAPPVTSGALTLENLTKQTVSVATADSLSTAQKSFQTYTLKPGEKKPVVMNGKSVFIFFGTKPKGEYYELEKGSFVIEKDETGALAVFLDEPQGNRDGVAADPMDGSWLWEEFWDVSKAADFSMDELKPKYVIDMDIAADGKFLWGEGTRLTKGQWKVSGKEGSQVLTLAFSSQGKTYKEAYTLKGYGTKTLELRAQDDPSILVYLTKRD